MLALAAAPDLSIMEEQFGRSSARRSSAVSQAIDSGNIVTWSTDMDGIVTMSEGGALTAIGLMPGQAVGSDIRTWPDIPFDDVVQRLKTAQNVTMLVKPTPPPNLMPEQVVAWSGVWVMTFAWNRSPSGRPIGVTCVTVPLAGAIVVGTHTTCPLGACVVEQTHAAFDTGEGRRHHRAAPGDRERD